MKPFGMEELCDSYAKGISSYHHTHTHTHTHRLKFAPIHGFQWIGDYLSVFYIPFNNAPGTCMQVCVARLLV